MYMSFFCVLSDLILPVIVLNFAPILLWTMQQTLLSQRSETGGSSPAMKVSGLERALQEVKSSSIDTNCLATDRHPSVVKLMREKYSNIEHVFDVWHVSKSLQKKLHRISTTKVNSSLQLWSKSIVNHVW